MAIQHNHAKEVVRRAKALNKKVVAGGPLFTGIPELWPEVDHLVLNEAEVTLPRFLADLRAGCPKRIYTSEEKPDLKQTPVPLWQLADMSKYAVMAMQYSRGCPFGCDFCDVTQSLGRKMRKKTVTQVLAELDDLYRRGWREQVFVVDDNFIANKAELKREILPAMIAWMKQRSYPFTFNTQVSVNLADDQELMALMVAAGFDSVFVGIETPDEESLAECNKGQNLRRDLVACVKKIQHAGMQVHAGFILGFDSDRPSIFERLIAFIQTSGITVAMVGLLNAPRGTRLHERLQSEGRLLFDSFGDNTNFSMNFTPKMDSQLLIVGYKRVVNTVYSPRHYCRTVQTLLRNYKPSRKGIPAFRDIIALLKSAWRLGILDHGRLYYWKLIFWTLFRKPQLLNVAVSSQIYGYHFRRIFTDFQAPPRRDK
jgi:radical SAM superfamily enzyme YgiQ (UPF0313 family)